MLGHDLIFVFVFAECLRSGDCLVETKGPVAPRAAAAARTLPSPPPPPRPTVMATGTGQQGRAGEHSISP